MPLSEILPTAPDIYTVKTRDTLWDISKLYLKSPWRWPELWGMNLEQIRNPHLIYPGQVLFLDKSNGRARLRMGSAGRRCRRRRPVAAGSLERHRDRRHRLDPVQPDRAVPQRGGDLRDQRARAPRRASSPPRKAGCCWRRGDLAYVRGDLGPEREYRIFREPRPLSDPTTKEILGYEATYVGASEYTVQGETRTDAQGKVEIIPATFTVTSIRKEAGVGDRLSPVHGARVHQLRAAPAGRADLGPDRLDLRRRADRRPEPDRRAQPRRGRRHRARPRAGAVPRRQGDQRPDRKGARSRSSCPTSAHGVLFVFRVFNRMSYALILSVKEPVSPGDRFTQP